MNTLPIEILEHEIFSRLNLRDLLSLTLTEKHSQPASHSFYRRCRIICNLILDESGKYIDHTYPIIRTIVRYPDIEYKILRIKPDTMINYHDYKIEPAQECYSILQNQILGRKLFENPDRNWINNIPGIEIIFQGNRVERDHFGNHMDSSFLYGAIRNIITKFESKVHPYYNDHYYVTVTVELKHKRCIPLCSIFSHPHTMSLNNNDNYHLGGKSIVRPCCQNICDCNGHMPLIKWSDPNEHDLMTSCDHCSVFSNKRDRKICPSNCNQPAPFLIYNNLIDRWIFVKFYNICALKFY
jgi:hypothetical protein